MYKSRRKSDGVSLTVQKFLFTINSFLKEIGQRVCLLSGQLTLARVNVGPSRPLIPERSREIWRNSKVVVELPSEKCRPSPSCKTNIQPEHIKAKAQRTRGFLGRSNKLIFVARASRRTCVGPSDHLERDLSDLLHGLRCKLQFTSCSCININKASRRADAVFSSVFPFFSLPFHQRRADFPRTGSIIETRESR